MNTDPKVLIVTSAFGDGHMKVAEAIEHSFRHRGINRITTLDLFAAVHPTLNELSRRFYLNNTGYTQEFYGFLYTMTSKMRPEQFMGRIIHSMGKRKVQRIIDEIEPDIIIHTFPYLAAAELASTTGSRIPLFTVMTDYVVHGRWLHPQTTKYFIASENMKATLMSAGIAEEKLVVSGIPIREAFEQTQDREVLLCKHGLNGNRQYLLLAAGAYGVLSDIGGLIKRVLLQSSFDVIVLCGNNHKLRAAMGELFQENPRVHILGYTEEMQELMCIASCLLTKAGGITLTEAMAQALPVIVYRPLPGQEAGNAEWLSGHHLIEIARNEEQLVEQLQRLEHMAYRDEREQHMKVFSRKSASDAIVTEALEAIKLRHPSVSSAKSMLVEGQAKTIHGYY
ncbi:MGDG synthase family glycosyltransferase [Paenibacillus pseudetheri]|uniref:Processive diacylglycerol beta-glucosyltransferase n=1 Tax=Paenibacillus pseudetheri TaxID=2897682 RepID=A0ABM9B937_9BACL|nr:glycosyltransferase [Paenibacillus pseudetheri]CAH1055232.1 Processive diacylglycerol beta-glucosyltransferase [Paenibacillus pseudetheri]